MTTIKRPEFVAAPLLVLTHGVFWAAYEFGLAVPGAR
jgi:hypothetical protein